MSLNHMRLARSVSFSDDSEIVDRLHGQNNLVQLRMQLRQKREAAEITAEEERRRLRETERRFIERRDTIRRKFIELRFF